MESQDDEQEANIEEKIIMMRIRAGKTAQRRTKNEYPATKMKKTNGEN